ncbi:MAG: autotransporter domain-containing protein, partial [Patescibacteria group bacterium]|nr:autotransporter domain-containing protein [Patescibacteria group bacterium]
MSRTSSFAWGMIWLGIAVFHASRMAGAAGFNQFVGLGDSTIDTGYFRFNSSGNLSFDDAVSAAVANGAKGGFAGNGVLGATILGDKFGVSAGPVGNGTGGTNYGNGGCFTAVPGPYPGSLSTTSQIQNYLASVHGVANPHALYVVSSGNNDLLHVADYPASFLSDSAAALATSVATLQHAGARTILVPNSFLYAVYAQEGGSMDPANAGAYAQSVSYNNLRWANLTSAGVLYVPADLDSVFRYVVQHPTAFGFTSQSVLSANHPSSVSAVLSDNSHITQLQQQTYLFIDGHHLTTAGQTIEADYEYNLLSAPTQISMLAENSILDGWTRAATIQGQIEASSQHCRPRGRNFWTSVGVYNTKVIGPTGFGGDSGSPFGGSIGFDYRLANGLILGGAMTFASQIQRFSTGGRFQQTDEAPSLYVAYLEGPTWGSAILTYDLFQVNVARRVPLGIYTDQNNGNTTGQNLSLALRGGRDFKTGRLTTGPTLGFIMQEARVYGFTETGDTGVTSLSFGRQTRESFVSQLGWRVLFDRGSLQPFAEVGWNHEYVGQNRMVTASLTSIAAPSYAMDAVPVATDWVTLSLGSYYKFSPRAVLRGGVSAMLANPQ